MSPGVVILQNTKKKSGHTHIMYMDNEVERKFIGWGSFIWEDKIGELKKLIVTKDLMLRNIYDGFQVKDKLSRLNKVPLFHLLKEKGLLFATPSNMLILQNHAIKVHEISSQIFLEFIQVSTPN